MSVISEKIKSMITGDKKVHFTKYLGGSLYYETEDGFEFPVPTSDIGNATFKAEDKAMLFMRYIRKHLEALAKGETEPEPFDEKPTDPDLNVKVLTPEDIKAKL